MPRTTPSDHTINGKKTFKSYIDLKVSDIKGESEPNNDEVSHQSLNYCINYLIIYIFNMCASYGRLWMKMES